jgi:hypothetical protein
MPRRWHHRGAFGSTGKPQQWVSWSLPAPNILAHHGPDPHLRARQQLTGMGCAKCPHGGPPADFRTRTGPHKGMLRNLCRQCQATADVCTAQLGIAQIRTRAESYYR